MNFKEIDMNLVLCPSKMLNCFKIRISNESNISIENIKCQIKEIDIEYEKNDNVIEGHNDSIEYNQEFYRDKYKVSIISNHESENEFSDEIQNVKQSNEQ